MAMAKALSLAKQGKDVRLYKLPQSDVRGPTMIMHGDQGKVVVTCRIKIA